MLVAQLVWESGLGLLEGLPMPMPMPMPMPTSLRERSLGESRKNTNHFDWE